MAEDILAGDPLYSDLLPAKKEATILRWAGDIDKINRIDMRPWDDIHRVLRWARGDDRFWRRNILSGKKFREKFSRLYQEAGGRGTERGVKPAPRPQAVLVNCRECMGDGICDISSDTLKQCGSFTAKNSIRQEINECF